jgi:hypothetical protein
VVRSIAGARKRRSSCQRLLGTISNASLVSKT